MFSVMILWEHCINNKRYNNHNDCNNHNNYSKVFNVSQVNDERKGNRTEWTKAQDWNVGQASETEWKKKFILALAAYPLCARSCLFFFHFPFPLSSFHSEREKFTPLWNCRVGTAQSSDRPKTHGAAVSANQKGALGRDYLDWPCID